MIKVLFTFFEASDRWFVAYLPVVPVAGQNICAREFVYNMNEETEDISKIFDREWQVESVEWRKRDGEISIDIYCVDDEHEFYTKNMFS